MPVKIEAEGHDYNDALRKLGGLKPAPAIAVVWRDPMYSDYGRTPGHGCIVTVDTEIGRVPREFMTMNEAADFIRDELLKREEYVVAQVEHNRLKAA